MTIDGSAEPDVMATPGVVTAESAAAIPGLARGGLWRHREFRLFWGGQTVSMVGSAISFIALPLVAVTVLHAGPVGLGLLTAVELVPPLLVGPLVGPLVDRLRRRRLMIAADVGRAALLGWVPLGALLHVLALWQLVAVAFGVGALSLFFEVSYQALLPGVVPSERLTDGNAKLSASQSVAEVTGPGLASWFMLLGGPAGAVLADAVSYVVSALCILRMRVREVVHAGRGDGSGAGPGEGPGAGRGDGPDAGPGEGSGAAVGGRLAALWADTRAGFPVLWGDRVLRSLTLSKAVLVFFAQMQSGIYFIFLVRTLHMSAAVIGVVFTLSSAGGFVSALCCDRLARRIGLGHLVVWGQLILIAGGVLLAAAQGPRVLAAVFIVAGEACFSGGLPLFNVGFTTLFQLRVPGEIRGRVIGAARFVTSSPAPLAALGGGGLAAAFDARTAMVVSAVGMLAGLPAVLRRTVLNLSPGAQDLGSDVRDLGADGRAVPESG